MQNKKKLDELILENQELASKMLIAHQDLTDEIINAEKEFSFPNEEKENQVAKLISENKNLSETLFNAHQYLAFQNKEKEKRAAELAIANVELDHQNNENEKLTAELEIANVELDHQNNKNEKLTDELLIANVELDHQNKEKEKLSDEFSIINKELEEFSYANIELKQFAFIASHELKEPLRTIANFIQIINEDNLGKFDEKTLEYFQIIDNSTKRMTILINTLLNFSRLGINKKLSNVDCKELIDSVLADLSVIVKSSKATIEVSEMPKLNVYEIEFRQIFQNLISNAIKFHKTDSPPKIQIRSEKINEGYKFSVSDDGIGIDPSHFDRVFDMFQRLHNTEEVFEGKGIGLAYCKKIVHMHKGEIWVESELGKGSTFYFTIFPISS